MKSKLIVALIVTGFILIAAFYYSKSKEELPFEVKFINGFEESEAVSWRLQWENHDLKAQKKDDEWYLESPYSLKINPSKSRSIVDNFLSLEKKSAVDEVSENWRQEKINVYQIKFKRDQELFEYVFTELNYFPDLDLVLLEYDEKQYLVEKWFLFGLKKKATELFSRNIFNLNPLEVELVTTPLFSFQKKGSGWEILNQTKQPKNLKKLNNIVVGLAYLKSDEVVLNAEERRDITSHASRDYSLKLKDKLTTKDLKLYQIKDQFYVLTDDFLYRLEKDNYAFFDYQLDELYQ